MKRPKRKDAADSSAMREKRRREEAEEAVVSSSDDVVLLGMPKSLTPDDVVFLSSTVALPPEDIAKDRAVMRFWEANGEEVTSALRRAVERRTAVVVEGPIGSGKTFTLAAFAAAAQPPNVVSLQMGEDVDAKSLVGWYAVTEVPGEFVWKAGLLSRAVAEGWWVVVEDVDAGPPELIAALHELAESRTLRTSAQEPPTEAHEDFRLFLTIRTEDGRGPITGAKAAYLDKFWLRISLRRPALADLTKMIGGKHASLANSSRRLAEIAESLLAFYAETSGRRGRNMGTRELLKWASRVSRCGVEDVKGVYREGFDVFCAHIADPGVRAAVAGHLAAHLSLNKETVDFFLTKHKAELKLGTDDLCLGRARLPRKSDDLGKRRDRFALHRSALSLLEAMAAGVQSGTEPLLLVGETGCGKTSLVQFLARYTGHPLHVINMSQQSESSDLLGGYKPVSLTWSLRSIKDDYVRLFRRSFPEAKNRKFLSHVNACLANERLSELVELMRETGTRALERAKEGELRSAWEALLHRLQQIRRVIDAPHHTTAFAFIEGVAIAAVESGAWVLLDEINLASPETLSVLTPILDALQSHGPVYLPDREEPVRVHPDFRLFAAMNPATDVGKAELSPGIRSRFTELYVAEISSREELLVVADSYLHGLSLPSGLLAAAVDFFLAVRAAAVGPNFSLRTLCRALAFAAENAFGNVQRSLYEGLCLSFLTEVERKGRAQILKLIATTLFGPKPTQLKALLANPGPRPTGANYVLVEGYWLKCGTEKINQDADYVITPTVRSNLRDLARILSSKNYPVLLEGETSVGKTSMIRYLAGLTGTTCVRINNHEHTDLAEYMGSYGTDADGRLSFVEGPLVRAVRHGGWLILDELNLAPPDVLEALNRLLDDNRQLFLPETQTLLTAHPDFRLLATQNPPGLYGGRKHLSRAFKNRFVELRFSELEPAELLTILTTRTRLPQSYAQKLIAVFTHLQVCRSEAGVFAGKETYMTLRDVFRWGERYRKATFLDRIDPNNFDWDTYMLQQGFMLLGGRCRRPEDASLVQKTLETEFKRKLDLELLFSPSSPFFPASVKALMGAPEWASLHWSRSLCRLLVLLGEATEYAEPVVLVGETGGGKTTAVQLLAAARASGLEWLNCHAMTEAPDFLGRLRPLPAAESGSDAALFRFVPGPLLRAMQSGAAFLLDEISLGEDSVLERLNSVLEPERTLQLTEDAEGVDGGLIVAAPAFRFFATMNPGGDYGKKELSKALRNRLTEIWCGGGFGDDELRGIVEQNLDSKELRRLKPAALMIDFINWLRLRLPAFKATAVTPRDLLAWVHFMDEAQRSHGLPLRHAFVHGAFLVFIDGIGSNRTGSDSLDAHALRLEAVEVLCKAVGITVAELDAFTKSSAKSPKKFFGINPFFIPKGKEKSPKSLAHNWESETSRSNTLRLLRAMTLPRGVLLEGAPGVGKSSLVVALAAAAGQRLTRLNFSEQTDVGDLFGCDVPVPGTASFAWQDGPLLTAMKEGHWVLMDEMNLASQAVLEGLNGCLDHRGEVFIPELARSFKVHPGGTRFFAAQNPFRHGGNRKGLPKSFLNRFTLINMESLTAGDHQMIIESSLKDGEIPRETLTAMVRFNRGLEAAVCEAREWGGLGSPWEFNLRDLLRWTRLMTHHKCPEPGRFVELLYVRRMRCEEDREKMRAWFAACFGMEVSGIPGALWLTEKEVGLAHSVLQRKAKGAEGDGLSLLQSSPGLLGPLATIVEQGWVALLVGSGGLGKTSAVRSLAALTGASLTSVPLGPETDALELLGSFEQTSGLERLKAALDRLMAAEAEPIRADWEAELAAVSHASDLEPLLRRLSALKLSKEGRRKLAELATSAASAAAGGLGFAWVDSPLLSALRFGGWVVLENVNLASGAVLDRLNAALEPGGTLVVAEAGLEADGRLPAYARHPDFRLFMTMDPRNGPISRAMRNRCVELAVLDHETWLRRTADGFTDFKSVLQSATQTKLDDEAVEKLHESHCLAMRPNSRTVLGSAFAASSVNSALIKRIQTHFYPHAASDTPVILDLESSPRVAIPRPLLGDLCASPAVFWAWLEAQWTAVGSGPFVEKHSFLSALASSTGLLAEAPPTRLQLLSTTSKAIRDRRYLRSPVEDVPAADAAVLSFALWWAVSRHLAEANGSAFHLARRLNLQEISADEVGSEALAHLTTLADKLRHKAKRGFQADQSDDTSEALASLGRLGWFLSLCGSAASGDASLGLARVRLGWELVVGAPSPWLLSLSPAAALEAAWGGERESGRRFLRLQAALTPPQPFETAEAAGAVATRLGRLRGLEGLQRELRVLGWEPSALLGAGFKEAFLGGTELDAKRLAAARELRLVPSPTQAHCPPRHLADGLISSLHLSEMRKWTEPGTQAAELGETLGVFDRLCWADASVGASLPLIYWLSNSTLLGPAARFSHEIPFRNVHVAAYPVLWETVRRAAEAKETLGGVEAQVGALASLSAFLWTRAPLVRSFAGEIPTLLLAQLRGTVEQLRPVLDLEDLAALEAHLQPATDVDAALRGAVVAGLTVCRLTVPPSAGMDPVYRRQLLGELLSGQLAEVEAELTVVGAWETRLWGAAWISEAHPHPALAALARRRRRLREALQQLSHERPAYRESLKKFHSLTRRLNEFLSATGDLGRKLGSRKHLPALQGWLRSAESLVEWVLGEAIELADIWVPFVSALLVVQGAVNLLCARAALAAAAPQADLVTQLSRSPRASVDAIAKTALVSDFSKLRLMSWLAGSIERSAGEARRLALDWALERWRELEEERQVKEQEGIVYSYKATLIIKPKPIREDGEEEDDDPDEEERLRLFPLPRSSEEDWAGRREAKLCMEDLGRLAEELLPLDGDGRSKGTAGGPWAVFQLCHSLMGSFAAPLTFTDSAGGLAAAVTAFAGFRRLWTVGEPAGERNPYLDEVAPTAVAALLRGLDALEARLAELKAEWPDMSVLDALLESSRHLRGLPLSSPLLRLAGGVEKLLSDCEEWEKVASRAVSLSEQLAGLRALLLEWRKEELRSWERLLLDTAADIRRHNAAAGLPILAAALDDEEPELALASALQWLRSASVRDFLPRLTFLRRLVTALELRGKTAAEKMPWDSLVAHWSIFEPIVQAKVDAATAVAEAQLRDFVGIVKFKDLNHWSLKESAAKAHRQLFNIIKKFKVSLMDPVLALTEDVVLPADFSLCAPSAEVVGEAPPCLKPVDADVAAKSRLLHRFAGDILGAVGRLPSQESAADALELAESVRDEVSRTENYVGTDKEKEKLAARAQMRKRTLLHDVFKDLQSGGVRHRAGARVDSEELTRELLLGLPASPAFRHLRHVAHARNVLLGALAKPHAQLGPPEVTRIKGLLQVFPQKLLAWLRAAEAPRAEVPKLRLLSEASAAAAEALKSRALPPQRAAKEAAEELATRLASLGRTQVELGRLAAALPTAAELPGDALPCPLNAESLGLLRGRLEELSRARLPSFDLEKSTIVSQSAILSSTEQLNVTISQLQPGPELEGLGTWTTSGPLGPSVDGLRSILKGLEASLRSLSGLCGAGGPVAVETSALLLGVQRMLGVLSDAPEEKEAQGLFDGPTLLLKLLTAARLAPALSTLEDALMGDGIGKSSQAGLECLSVVAGQISRLMESLLRLFDGSVRTLSFLYLSLLRTFIHLAREGFVRPIPKTDTGAEAGKGKESQDLEDVDGDEDNPAGMGEGAGLKDVGAELEETGQVEGERGAEEEDGGRPDEAETPLDMEDDFGGNLEDLNLDGADDDEDDERPEEDWEKGDADAAEEETLDPNLWDEEKQDDPKDEAELDAAAANKASDEIGAKEDEAAETLPEKDDAAAAADGEPGEDADDQGKEEEKPADDAMDVENDESTGLEAEADEETDFKPPDAEDETEPAQSDQIPPQLPVTEEEPAGEEEEDKDADTRQGEDKAESADAKEESTSQRSGGGQQQRDAEKEETAGEKEDKEDPTEAAEPEEEAGGAEKGATDLLPSNDGERSKPRAAEDPEQKADAKKEKPNSRGQDPRSLAEQKDQRSIREKAELGARPEESADAASDAPKDGQVYSHGEDLGSGEAEMGDSATLDEALLQRRGPEDEDQELQEHDPQAPDSSQEAMDEGETGDEPVDAAHSTGIDPAAAAEEEMASVAGDAEWTPWSKDRPTQSSIHTAVDLLNASSERRDASRRIEAMEVEEAQATPEGRAEWSKAVAATATLAAEFAESLRLVLEPTQSSKLQGDYRSGKRLNIRKLIPYVASNFRKNKIWLRRTKKSKRDYKILIALDDSKSMCHNRTREMAVESVALLSGGLGVLETGELGVASFGAEATLVHPFGAAFTDAAAGGLLSQLTFAQDKTNIIKLMESLLLWMGEGDGSSSRLVLIVSDGRGLFAEGMEAARRSVAKVMSAGIFLVFLILDSPDSRDSITDIRVPIFGADGSVELRSYLDFFPFPFFVLLRHVEALPPTVAEALRQWFQLVHAQA